MEANNGREDGFANLEIIVAGALLAIGLFMLIKSLSTLVVEAFTRPSGWPLAWLSSSLSSNLSTSFSAYFSTGFSECPFNCLFVKLLSRISMSGLVEVDAGALEVGATATTDIGGGSVFERYEGWPGTGYNGVLDVARMPGPASTGELSGTTVVGTGRAVDAVIGVAVGNIGVMGTVGVMFGDGRKLLAALRGPGAISLCIPSMCIGSRWLASS